MPPGSGRILDTRSLAASHRRLADLLQPAMRVLDVGCGSGAITCDIAARVGASGLAVGFDTSDTLLAQAARLESGAHFVRADLFALPCGPGFDVVTAARTLQWVSRPGDAVRALAGAARAGGTVLVLDYDHERVEWTPAPPPSMRRFYAAFLRWRSDAGFDNAIAGHLATLFESAGLVDVRVTPQHEHTRRGDPDFLTRVGLWAEVAALRGPQMVRDGAIAEAECREAETEYRRWAQSAAQSQTLFMLAVEGTVRRSERITVPDRQRRS